MKYMIREDLTMEHEGTKLYRIEALKDFGDVSKGDIGGWVESEENLSQLGKCWISDNAIVKRHSIVSGNACVLQEAIVHKASYIEGDACVAGKAVVKGSIVRGHAVVKGSASIHYSVIRDTAVVKGKAEIIGCCIGEQMKVGGSAIIDNDDCLFVRGRCRSVTFYKDKVCGIGAGIGCQIGISLEEFEDRIFNDDVYLPSELPKHRLEYLEFIKLAKNVLGGKK